MERYDARYQRHSYSLWFYTLSLPCFDSLYSLFYANSSKQIPADIASKDMPKLRALVLPYLHSSMHSKITQSKFPRVPYGVKIVSATSGPHKDNLVVSTGCMLETP